MIQILDSTLREGEQTPGVKFNYQQKLRVAKLLDSFGVDFIEIGNPSISKTDFKDIQRLAKQPFVKSQLICHARATKQDIELVKATGVEWVGIFTSINELGLKYKLNNRSRAEVLTMVKDALTCAKSCGLKIRFTIEDASRTEWADIKQVIQIATANGADRISLADTVGILTPTKTHALITKVKSITTVPLHFHGHNDFGLAVANALAAYEAGVDLIDVSVSALGERTGIASLEQVTFALCDLYGVPENSWNFKVLDGLVNMVGAVAALPISPRTPITGSHAYIHDAGLHTRAMLQHPSTYESVSPDRLGRRRKIFIDTMVSKEAFKFYLEKSNITLSDQEMEASYEKVKNGQSQINVAIEI